MKINNICDAGIFLSLDCAWRIRYHKHADKIYYKSPEPDERVGFYLSVSRRR